MDTFWIRIDSNSFDYLQVTLGQVVNQTSQKAEPVAVTESAKQVAEATSPPKVNYATDLFDMLSMDSPTDNGSEAASTDDNSWAGFQCMSSHLLFET